MIMAAKEVVGMEVRGGMTNELVFWKYEMASRQFIIREGSWGKSCGRSNDNFDDGDDDSDNDGDSDDSDDNSDDGDDDSENDDDFDYFNDDSDDNSDDGDDDSVPAKPCLESDAESPSWQGRGPGGNKH